MSLFTNLLNLHSTSKPLEDFFTEIVAYFFSIHQDLLISWLQQNLVITDNSYSSIKITTQKYYEPLENHDRGSQPDIVIELADDTKTEIIFIESKIGSTEGWRQLKNYAEILSNILTFLGRALVQKKREKKRAKLKTKTLQHSLLKLTPSDSHQQK